MSPRTFLFLLLVASFFLAAPCEAQWGYYTSNRNAYQLYRQDQRGMFFPEKKPEDQEITLGPVQVRPGLGASETWTSNVTLTPFDAQDDFYTQLFPALRLRLPYKQNTFEAEYMGNFAWYSKHPQYNADDHYFTARARVDVFKDSWINIESTTAMLYTPVGDIRTYSPQYDNRRRFNYYRNYIGFNPAAYKRFAVMINYENSMSRFENEIDQQDNYNRHNPQVMLGYSVFRKTRLLLGYAFTDYRGNELVLNNDYNEHRVILGVEWALPYRIQLNLRADYNWDFYMNAGISPQFWGANMNLDYSPLERLKFRLAYERFSNPTLSYTGDRPNPVTGTGSIYYIQDQATASCAYNFRDNLLMWVSVLYRRLDFPPDGRLGTDRLDNLYGGTAQLIYQFRPWLRFSLAGGYSRGDSTDIQERYEDISGQFYAQCAF